MGGSSAQATPVASQLNAPVDEGKINIEVTFPTDGQYIAFVDFRPSGGNNISLAVPIKVGAVRATAITLTPDTSLTRPVGDLLVTLQLNGALVAGQDNLLSFTTIDSKGQSRNEEIELLSGNECALYVIDEKSTTFLRPDLTDRGKLQFSVNFPKPGKYKVWFDFIYANKQRQISYVLDVK